MADPVQPADGPAEWASVHQRVKEWMSGTDTGGGVR